MGWSKTEKVLARQLCEKSFAKRMKEFRVMVASKAAGLEDLNDVDELFSAMREKDKEWHFFMVSSWTYAFISLRYQYNYGYISDEDLAPFSDERYRQITSKDRKSCNEELS